MDTWNCLNYMPYFFSSDCKTYKRAYMHFQQLGENVKRIQNKHHGKSSCITQTRKIFLVLAHFMVFPELN